VLAWVGVAVAVAAIAVSAPVTSVTAAPALGLAFWRAALGTASLGPWLLAARPLELARAGSLPRRRAVLAGVWLALHFTCWLPSLRLTSVAASTALVATTPVWTTLFARFRGEPVPPGRATGVGLAMLGILAVTGVDLGRSWSAAAGDLLALAGGVAGAGYVDVGERARQQLSATAYSTVAYGVCGLLMLPVCLVARVSLLGYSGHTWLQVAVIVVGAQLVGHSTLNAALPVVGATPLALALLLEVPGAVLVSWVWYATAPPVAVLPGTLLLLAGLVAVLRARPVAHVTPPAPT
jgi:drug/metabolite transporter (DMT)-like permease